MTVFVSAYACCPDRGSEPGVGWNFVREMAKRHDLIVLARRYNKKYIDNSGESWTARVKWVWYDLPERASFWTGGRSGGQRYYVLWQFFSARFARHAVDFSKIDRIHHITFGRYWIPSFLCGKRGDPPLVFGPVGGGDETPPVFRSAYSFNGRLREKLKSVSERLFTFCFRRQYHFVSLAIAATEQTACKLRRLVSCPVRVFPQSALESGELETMRRIASTAMIPKTPSFVVVCRLVHWKAVDLAIRAMPHVLRELPEARLEIIGVGPEKGTLEALIDELHVGASVRIVRRFDSRDGLCRKIASSTALVHPALHESFGQVCLEALALGIPVICWNHAGPGVIAAGQPVPPVPIPQSGSDLSGLASAMVSAWRNRVAFFPEELVWSAWCDRVDAICKKVLAR